MENKLVLQKQPKVIENYSKPVFIDSDTYKKVTELKNETGIQIKQIINRFVEFALENVEIKGESK